VSAISTAKSRPTSGVEVHAKTVALMRLMLAASGLFIFALNPAAYSDSAANGYDTLTLYFAYAYCAYAALQFAFPAYILKVIPLVWLHWVDVAWFALLITPSGGLDSPFLPFFFFAILHASFNYGFIEGMRVTIACFLLPIVVHFSPIHLLFFSSPPEAQHPIYPAILRSTSLLVLGYLIARWGGLEMLQKRQLKLLSEINRMPDPHLSAEQVMGESLKKIRQFYDARTCLAVMKMPDASYVIFKVDNDPEKPMQLGQPLDKAIANHLLLLPAQYSLSYASNAEWFLSSMTTYESTATSRKRKSKYGEAISQLLEADSFVSAPLHLRGQNMGRLYLISCSDHLNSSDVSFLQQLANQITPHIENIHLLDHIASAATSTMRQKISLDLHDSTIQPYIGLKLGLEALHRKIPENDAIAGEVADLIRMTGEGIAELRNYIGGLKTRLEGPLLPAIRHMAEKYQQSHGIKVVVNADNELKISDRLAAEIYQIVGEAMSNIRRHTNANEATINLYSEEGQLIVQVANHNAGQDFRSFKPRSISERVASLGGTVKVKHDADGTTAVTAEIPL
jgi:signal transduction histidine kinase